MKIGIIVAEIDELEAIQEIMNVKERKKVFELIFIKGTINKKTCILVKSEAGKVNAARATQILIDEFSPDYILNTGAAGALNPMLQIGDIIIGEKLIQHDFDVTAFGHTKGYVSGVGDKIYSDTKLIKIIENSIKEKMDKKYKVKKGIIATGDVFCTDVTMRDKIYANFDAECIEMEGAAVAQVCHLCHVPFVVIRSISDTPNGENTITYNQFKEMALERCANIVKEFLKEIE